MGIFAFLAVLLLAVDVWLYMEIRWLRRRMDDMDEDMEITWTWCDTHAKVHVEMENKHGEIELPVRQMRDEINDLKAAVDALGDITIENRAADPERDRYEREFFDGISNILSYTYNDARKAAANDRDE